MNTQIYRCMNILKFTSKCIQCMREYACLKMCMYLCMRTHVYVGVFANVRALARTCRNRRTSTAQAQAQTHTHTHTNHKCLIRHPKEHAAFPSTYTDTYTCAQTQMHA